MLVLDPLERYLHEATQALDRGVPWADAAERWSKATARLDEPAPISWIQSRTTPSLLLLAVGA